MEYYYNPSVNPWLNILYQDDDIKVNTIFILDNNILSYTYKSTSNDEIMLIKESLIHNFIIENVFKTLGEMKGYSLEELNLFFQNMAKIKPNMTSYGFTLENENYDYTNLEIKDDKEEADIELDIYLEKIANNGHGMGTYIRVENIPKIGYMYDQNKSNCQNKSELKFLSSDNFQINALGKDICSAYFTLDNLFSYDLQMDIGLIKNLRINIDDFTPVLKEIDLTFPEKSDKENNSNPNTGNFLPLGIIFLFLISSTSLIYYTKRKNKIFKI